MTSDIFAGQPTDAALLAEIYDLEHDAVREDHAFYRQAVRRAEGTVIDLGCGSGRLFPAFVAGGAARIVGVDGSRALLERAAARIAADARLAAARDRGDIELVEADLRSIHRPDRFGLVVLAGVLAHLSGPEDAVRALTRAASLLEPEGTVIVDGLGPGGIPQRDLPLSVDWRGMLNGREVVRRSELVRREVPEGVRVLFSTLVDAVRADGTIARLPASFRLWYPFPSALLQLVGESGLVVDATYGSHDLEELDRESDRCIVIARLPARRRPPIGQG